LPRVIPKQPRFADDEVMAFATDLPDGSQLTIRRGTRLKGSHPAAQAAPWYFQKDGATEDELLTEWNVMAEPEQPQPEFHKPAPPIPELTWSR
jgi:hypothetical protein